MTNFNPNSPIMPLYAIAIEPTPRPPIHKPGPWMPPGWSGPRPMPIKPGPWLPPGWEQPFPIDPKPYPPIDGGGIAPLYAVAIEPNPIQPYPNPNPGGEARLLYGIAIDSGQQPINKGYQNPGWGDFGSSMSVVDDILNQKGGFGTIS